MMGFYEDDRIRKKNAAYNSASMLYDELKINKWSNSDIMAYANEGLSKDPRNEVMNALIRLCNSSIEGVEDQSFGEDTEEPTYWFI